MKIAIFLIGLTMCLGLIPLTSIAIEATASGKGIIEALSIEGNMIVVDKKEYTLNDRLQVVNKHHIAAGDVILEKGQSIEFWVDNAAKDNLHLPKDKRSNPVIKRIRVLSDVNMDY